VVERRMTVTTGPPVHGGYALARPEGMGVLFVRWALPGEVVSVRLVGRKREYAFAEAVEVLSPSPRRVDPPCEVFRKCGGCQLQHADYPYQLEMKREILREAFRRIGRRTSRRRSPHRRNRSVPVPGEVPGGRGEGSGFTGAVPPPGAGIPLPADDRRDQRRPPGLRGLGRFATSPSPGGQRRGRASASFPGVPFGKEMVEHLAERTGASCRGAVRGSFVGGGADHSPAGRDFVRRIAPRLLPGELADEPGDGAPGREILGSPWNRACWTSMRAPGTSRSPWRPRSGRSSRSKGRRGRSRSCAERAGNALGTSGSSVRASKRSGRKGGSTRWFSTPAGGPVRAVAVAGPGDRRRKNLLRLLQPVHPRPRRPIPVGPVRSCLARDARLLPNTHHVEALAILTLR